tara:strand:- start:12075 stop:12434 length:360 start_codon:yes stop_codon:yes gene_type:complete
MNFQPKAEGAGESILNEENSIRIEVPKERVVNDMGDFVIDGELSIKELYELAKKEGFEDRTLFFSVKNKETGQHFSTHNVVSFGKGWSKGTAIMNLTWKELKEMDACVDSPSIAEKPKV